MNELAQLTLVEAATAIRRRKISSVELTRACIDQAKAVQPKLNCFIALEEEDALKAARKADQALKRSTRVGFGYAQACWLHGKDIEMGELRRLLRPWLWTIGVPLAAAAATAFWGWQAIALWLVYPLGIWRSASKEAGSWGWRLTYASFLMLGKLPEWVGEWQFWLGQARGKASSVSFDYKR